MEQEEVSAAVFVRQAEGHAGRTCRVFTDEVVLGFTVVIVPLEHIEAPRTRRGRRLVIHDHTHFVTARRLVPVPVSARAGIQPVS